MSLFLMFLSSNLHACDCPESSTEQKIEQANAIFQGKVVDINTNWMSGGMKVGISVEKVWKGQIGSFIFLNTPFEAKCGQTFEKDQTYLVFANQKRSIKTDKCLGSQPINEATQTLNILGQGQEPSARNVKPMMLFMTALTILALLFLAFIILAKNKNRNAKAAN